MYSSNYQRPTSPQVTGYGINYNQNQIHQNIPRQSYSPQQQFNQQYQYQQYVPQQYSFQQYNNTNSPYGIQNTQQSQNSQLKINYQSPTNLYQQQSSNYQNHAIGHQYSMRNQQQFQSTNNYHSPTSIPMIRERSYSGSQAFQQIHSGNVSSPYMRQSEPKNIQNNFQHYHGQQMNHQINDYAAENSYLITSNRPNHLSPTPSPTTVQYNNYRKLDIGEINTIGNNFNHQENFIQKQNSNPHVVRNIPPTTIENQQQYEMNIHINNTLNIDDKNNLKNVQVQNSFTHPLTTHQQQHINNTELFQDPNIEYEKAVKKLKDNEEKIKIILERQQIDGKITDAKERIERLERIINLQEKVSLNFINRFINATDAKIMDENLCKPVMDAFDNIVKAADKYKSFQIPHFDPFHELKEKFLEVPDFVKYSKIEDDDDPTPYYLRKEKSSDNKVVDKKVKDNKRRRSEVEINEENYNNEILQELDERTKLVLGKDGKEHLMILCDNEKYLTLSETITKDLKSCGKFKVDHHNIPISDHCRGINFIITFDKIGIPPLNLHIPIDYPKGICSIVNPNYNSEIRDISLNKLISRVEQALPCLSVYRRIQNIAITWMNLAMNV